jgi:predicted RNA-binding Zn-ribbon protein involved in translation (DUF1610 family)
MGYICGGAVWEPDFEDDDFEEYIFTLAASEPKWLCPFCGEWYHPESAEYLYIDLGCYEQISPYRCEECGAYQLGNYEMNAATQDYCEGWVRTKITADQNFPAGEFTYVKTLYLQDFPRSDIERDIENMDLTAEQKILLRTALQELVQELQEWPGDWRTVK